jgi:hypothetical protein
MPRQSSFVALKDSVIWLGEQAQTQFLDRNLEAHKAVNGNGDDEETAMLPVSSIPKMIMNMSHSTTRSYNPLDFNIGQIQTVAFPGYFVVHWLPGCNKNNLVSMKFRVTLHWNDTEDLKQKAISSAYSESSSHNVVHL